MGSEDWRLAQAFRYCADALMVLDGGGRVVAINRAAEELFGFHPERVLGHTVHELEARGDVLPEGPRVEVAVAPIPHDHPEAPALVVSARPVGDREWVVGSLHELAEMVDARSGGVLLQLCHELLTPLNAVVGFSQLAEGEGLSEPVRDYLKEVNRAALRMEEMVRRVAEYARLCRGERHATSHPLPLHAMVEETVAFLPPLPTGLVVENQVHSDLWVRGDETGLRRVLANLIENAVTYHPGGGRVWVEGEVSGGRARISVCDDGAGIAPEDQARVFWPFESLGRGKGLGLGLALCQKWVECMGGEMGLVSPCEGDRGCRVWFTLPVASPDQRGS